MPEQSGTDQYLWLEDVTGDDALDWVRAHNEPTLAELGGERFEQMRAEALEVLDTDTRIPYVRRRGEYLYNFWRDAANPRGLWRRTTLESYRTDGPDWDVLIDVDALAAADDENWVWAGADVIEPDLTLALVGLSRGGSDATVVREFDMPTRAIRRRRLRAAGGQDRHQLGGRGHRAGGHRLRRRLADRVRLSAHRQAVAARAAAGRRARRCSTGEPSDVSVGARLRSAPPASSALFIARSFDFFNRERYELRGDELITYRRAHRRRACRCTASGC